VVSGVVAGVDYFSTLGYQPERTPEEEMRPFIFLMSE
jgi:hypothetical protein